MNYNNETLLLSDNDAQKFVEIMQNPPKPSNALIALLKGDRVKCAEGMTLPIQYKNFLLCINKNINSVFRGSDYSCDDLQSIQVWAKQLLAENNFTEPLPNDAFVFFMHQGYQFSFFKLSDGDNPPVYSYCEGQQENYFIKTDESFGAFLGNELELKP